MCANSSNVLQLSSHPSPEKRPTLYTLSDLPSGHAIAAPNIEQLFDVYLSERSPAVRKRTLENYRHHTRPFWAWWSANGPQWEYTLNRERLQKFSVWLGTEYRTERGHKPSANTVHTVCTRIRAFLRWLHESGRSPIQMADWIPIPSVSLPQPRSLSSDEIVRLLDACTGTYRIRNLTLIVFLLETGVRRFEAAAVTWENVRIAPDFSGSVFLEVVKGYLSQDKRRTVVFGPKTGKLLQLLRITHGVDAGSVFGLTGSGIGQVMMSIKKSSGVDFGAHDFRRTFSTCWIKKCEASSPSLAEQLLDVQLGHAPQTVAQRHYVSLTYLDVAERYVSPLDSIGVFGL